MRRGSKDTEEDQITEDFVDVRPQTIKKENMSFNRALTDRDMEEDGMQKLIQELEEKKNSTTHRVSTLDDKNNGFSTNFEAKI